MKGRQDIPVAELESEIVAFLDRMANKPGGTVTKPGCNMLHGKGCALGTCVDNTPRVTPIDLYHDGLTVWIAGEPGGKIANIMRNPKVSVGVYEPVDHSLVQKSLQVFGTAELINAKNNLEEFFQRSARFGLTDAMEGMFDEYIQGGLIPADRKQETLEKIAKMINWIKITPQKMILLCMEPGKFPLKKTWEPGRATMQTAGG